MKTRKRQLVTERTASTSPVKRKRSARKEDIDQKPTKKTISREKGVKAKETNRKDVKSKGSKSKNAGKAKGSKSKGKEVNIKAAKSKEKAVTKVVSKAKAPPVQQTESKKTVVLRLSPAHRMRRMVNRASHQELEKSRPDKKTGTELRKKRDRDLMTGNDAEAGWVPADERAQDEQPAPESTPASPAVELAQAEPRLDGSRTGSPSEATADKEGGVEEPVTDLECPEEEHNYSKDPRGELMKMNLPIYACSMCKKYTFDPQQSALHARKVHNAKVGIILMLPLEEIKIPQKTPTGEAEPEITSPPQSSSTNSLVSKSPSVVANSKKDIVKPNELANVERERSPKKIFECEKCNRQFDRERQMSMHKCIQVVSKRQSPRRAGEGERSSQAKVDSPMKLVKSPQKIVTSSPSPEGSSTPVKDQQEKVTSEEEKKGEKDLDNKTGNGARDEESNKNERVEVRMLEDLKKKQPELISKSVTETEDESVMDFGTEDDDDYDDEEDLNDIEIDDEQVEISNISIDDEEEIFGGADKDSGPDPPEDPSGNDEMMLQWQDRGPPTTEELDKFIRPVQGGLQSGHGQPILFFMCLVCRKVFKTRNVLKPHLFSHLGYRPFCCNTCGYSASHSHALQVHMKKHFGNNFKCWYSNCRFVAKGAEELTQHRISHALSMKCVLCRRTFRSHSTLLGHLCIKHVDEIKEGKGKKFYMRMVMTGRRSSQIVLFQCNICGRKSKTKKGYYEHIRTHSSLKATSLPPASHMRKKFPRKSDKDLQPPPAPVRKQCPMCETTLFGEPQLVKHMLTHPFVYRCSMCEEKFLTYGSLNEHVGSHRDYMADFNPQEKINESLRKSFYLSGEMDKALEADKVQWAQRRTGALAPKSAITGSVFDELMAKISIPSEFVSKEEVEELGAPFTKMEYKRLTPSILRYIHMRFGNVECGVCGKLFAKVGLCKEHTKKHNKVKEFMCTKCPYQVSLKSTLQKHMATVHGEGEKFFCETCKSDIIGKEVYDNHMRRHSAKNQGPLTCTWCNTTAAKRDDMKKHIMNTHPLMPVSESTKILGKGVVIHREKGAPFLVCEVCSETFRRICDLRRHMWKHSAVKRFTCDLCDYGSDKRTNIVSHMRKHSQEKAHQCEYCSKAYKTEQSLKLHVRTAHLKVKPYKCDLCDYAASQPVHLRRHKFLHHSDGDIKRFKCAICPDYSATDLQIIKRHYKKKHPMEQLNLSKCCPSGIKNPSMVRKDKHQVIQVVPSLQIVQEPEPQSIAEELVVEEQVQENQSASPAAVDVPESSNEIENQTHQITEDMTIEVVLPEEQAQILNINSALPDVIHALAALQEKDFSQQ